MGTFVDIDPLRVIALATFAALTFVLVLFALYEVLNRARSRPKVASAEEWMHLKLQLSVYDERNSRLEDENENLKRLLREFTSENARLRAQLRDTASTTIALSEPPPRPTPSTALTVIRRRPSVPYEPVIPPLQTVFLGPREDPEA